MEKYPTNPLAVGESNVGCNRIFEKVNLEGISPARKISADIYLGTLEWLRGVKDGLKWWEFVPADGGDEQEIWGAGMSCWSIESPLYTAL